MTTHLHFWTKSATVILIAGFSAISAAKPIDYGAPQRILPKLHLINQSEIKAGDMGKAKACRSDVARYGDQLSVDHAKNDAQVTVLAQKKTVVMTRVLLSTWEKQNIAKQKMTMAQLEKIADCSFDSNFLGAMKEGHEFAIQVLEMAIAAATDEELKTFLSETLVAVKAHLQMAIDLMAAE